MSKKDIEYILNNEVPNIVKSLNNNEKKEFEFDLANKLVDMIYEKWGRNNPRPPFLEDWTQHLGLEYVKETYYKHCLLSKLDHEPAVGGSILYKFINHAKSGFQPL